MKRFALVLVVVLIALSTVISCTPPAPPPEAEPAPVPETAPAEFEVTSLVVTPYEAKVGQPVEVTATVENIGETSGCYIVTLTVDGLKEEVKDITVAPGATEAVVFTLVRDAAGTYDIEVAGLIKTLKVTGELTDYDKLYRSLVEVTSQDDLDSLSARGGVSGYIEIMVEAQQEIPWALFVPPELVRDYILPVRFHPAYNLDTAYYYPEKVENWRVPMYEKARVIIGATSDPSQAVKKLAEWVHANIPYLAQNQPRYLQPTLILSRGGGSCWQNATLLAALYRSVYLPARIVVGACYWSTEVQASGTSFGTDLELILMEKFWISRDWELWYKDLKVHDDSADIFLSDEQYDVSIQTVTEAGKERLVLGIPSHVALDHRFTATLEFAAPQGHEWVEVYTPGSGWIDVDGTEYEPTQGLNFFVGQFDMQAYNPASKNWESSYFFYKFSQPINTLIEFCEHFVALTEDSGIDVSEPKIRFNEARSSYESVCEQELSAEERQEKGEQIYQLLGEAIVLCKSEGESDKFYNIWDITQQSPETVASDLAKENVKSMGVLLPYNVFDLAEIKRLYAWKGYGIKPPYVNEVKREYFWLEAFRSSLPKDTDLYIIIVGYNPISSQWKATLTQWQR